jgi:hypothetical protein
MTFNDHVPLWNVSKAEKTGKLRPVLPLNQFIWIYGFYDHMTYKTEYWLYWCNYEQIEWQKTRRENFLSRRHFSRFRYLGKTRLSRPRIGLGIFFRFVSNYFEPTWFRMISCRYFGESTPKTTRAVKKHIYVVRVFGRFTKIEDPEPLKRRNQVCALNMCNQ